MSNARMRSSCSLLLSVVLFAAPPLHAADALVEFHNTALDHYFLTIDPVEAAAIDGGSAGPGWARTGKTIGAYRTAASAPGGAAAVCRYYGNAARGGPNGHFYTADAAECAAVKLDPGWTFERVEFYVPLPVNGACPAGGAPVYRVYNGRYAQHDSNHRYTTEFATYNQMIAAGWMAEGVVFCSAPAAPGAFRGNIVLGAPTATAVKANVFSPDQSGRVALAFGRAPGSVDGQTAPVALAAGTALEIPIEGLAPDTRYYYRLQFDAAGGTGSGPTVEYTFHTARPPGSTFTFTIQADSHLDENSDLNLYRRTLANVLADAPDFHVDLGDTFMTEKHADPLSGTSPPAASAASVDARYRYEQANFATLAHSAPLFLVNGNHEGEAGWMTNGTAQSLGVWTTRARQQYFVNPVPDGFYSGDTVAEPFVGQRASWYAWQWGDALFVVLDPYWHTASKPAGDGWTLTLGARQYAWLEQTLAASRAKYKFVFTHSLVGGLDGQMRGGVEAAPFFEWGGRNADGTNGFAAKRPGWGAPIHTLLVRHGVTAVFHGHDHLYAKQTLDGIVYQEVPQPSAKNTSSGANLAADYHYTSGTILSSAGHLRVTVAPGKVTAEYVRAWLPASETAARRNGQVDDAWSVGAAGTAVD